MKLKDLKELLSDKTTEERLEILSSAFSGKIIFTTSFGIEDQAITHMIFTKAIDIKVATIDTGRLFPQTYDTFSGTMSRYRRKIDVYFPEHEDVEKMVSEKGPYSFYESVENRKECCRVRKVVPLNRALSGMECWISGIRTEQSGERKSLDWIEFDESRNIFKYYPVFDWTMEQVENYVRDNNIPYNTMHNKGFISIGCEPCTRAVAKDQDFRAGRWWWENDGPKECGLHTHK